MRDEDLQVGGPSDRPGRAVEEREAGTGVGRLLVCPTPIGNLEDVTLRVLGGAGNGGCGGVRGHAPHAGAAGAPWDRGAGAGSASTSTTNVRARRELVARMRTGATVALVSDAGTPLISDPGYELVRASIAAGLAVEALPGPSAAVSALVASGLPARALVLRRLPAAASARSDERVLAEADRDARGVRVSAAPGGDAGAARPGRPERPVAVCRELSKLHEEVRRGSAAELAAHYGELRPRGEVVVVVGGAAAGAGDRERALAALRELVAAGARARPAASALARLTGTSANELYRALVDERVARLASSARGRGSSLGVADVLLRDDPDLLRQCGPAPRARVHDDRRGRAGAAHASARGGGVLPERDRRARRAGGAGGGARGSRRRRSWPIATRSASRR